MKKNEKCWLCNLSTPRPRVFITVASKGPGKRICKEKKVRVHSVCYMDIMEN